MECILYIAFYELHSTNCIIYIAFYVCIVIFKMHHLLFNPHSFILGNCSGIIVYGFYFYASSYIDLDLSILLYAYCFCILFCTFLICIYSFPSNYFNFIQCISIYESLSINIVLTFHYIQFCISFYNLMLGILFYA